MKSDQAPRSQLDAVSQSNLAEYRYGSAEAPHTAAYLWPQIITLCAELGARRVIDVGCGNGALCRELARLGYEVRAFSSHGMRRPSWRFIK